MTDLSATTEKCKERCSMICCAASMIAYTAVLKVWAAPSTEGLKEPSKISKQSMTDSMICCVQDYNARPEEQQKIDDFPSTDGLGWAPHQTKSPLHLFIRESQF